jgi:hypothetical protein
MQLQHRYLKILLIFMGAGGMEINIHNLNIFKHKPQLLEKAQH